MQNVKDWTDRFGERLEIGQQVVAVRGRTLHVGDILWFTAQGVTINSYDEKGDSAKVSIVNYNKRTKLLNVLVIDNLTRP
jgi:hypothetical protein